MELSRGSLQSIIDGVDVSEPIFKVVAFKAVASNSAETRYRLHVTDGVSNNTYVMLATQLNKYIDSGKIQPETIIKLDKYMVNTKEKKIIIILELSVIGEQNNNSCSSSIPKPVAVSVSQVPVTRPQINSRSHQGNITPISHINSYQNRWTIEGRVSQKSAIKTWSNAKGEGKLFNFVLCDNSCDVKIVAFNNEVTKFFEIIQLGKTYSISKGSVKAANAKYNNTHCEFEIQLNSDSDIHEIEDKIELPKMQFDFVPILEISNKPVDSFIDIVGIVHEVMDVSTITNKTTNREMIKRDTVLVDRSGSSIKMTLWGDDVKLVNNLDHPVIVVKGAYVKEFYGKTISLVNSSTVLINPSDIPEAMALVGWYDECGSSLTFQSQQSTLGGLQLQTKMATISELVCTDNSEKAEYFSISSSVSQFRREKIVYKACPVDKCNKKLIDLTNGLYKCEKCDTEGAEFNFRLLLSMDIIDFTGSTWVTAFQEIGQLVLGRSAEEIGNMVELEKKEELDNMFDDALYKEFIFKLKVKNESFNDETRMKVTVIDAKEVNHVEAINRIISQI